MTVAMPHLPAAARSESDLVSVIIPVYQGECFIVGAVQSALRQTHREIEVWVVDDGSTDATIERLAAIADPRLKVLRQANAGTAAARNAALALARGKYVAFLDSDDRWFPEKLEAELAVLRCASQPIGIAYSSHYAVDDEGRLLHAAPVRSHAGNAFEILIDGDDFLMPSLCLFDRRVFETIGTFDTRRYHEDHDLILRATRRFPIYPTQKRLAVYRQTMGGKCRRILADYDAALREEVALADDLDSVLSVREAACLRTNVLRALYLRFLMYGFDEHARRLGRSVDLSRLGTGPKGRLGWVFAKTGLNLVAPARIAVQSFHRITRQSWWRSRLAASGLELGYE